LAAVNKSSSGELTEIAKLLELSAESTAYLLARMAAKEELVLQVKNISTAKKAKSKVKRKTAKKKAKPSAKKKKSARKK